MFELEVLENRALGDDVLQQSAKIGDVPLAVAQLLDQMVLGFLGRNLEGLVESTVGRVHAKSRVQQQERFAYGIDDVL